MRSRAYENIRTVAGVHNQSCWNKSFGDIFWKRSINVSTYILIYYIYSFTFLSSQFFLIVFSGENLENHRIFKLTDSKVEIFKQKYSHRDDWVRSWDEMEFGLRKLVSDRILGSRKRQTSTAIEKVSPNHAQQTTKTMPRKSPRRRQSATAIENGDQTNHKTRKGQAASALENNHNCLHQPTDKLIKCENRRKSPRLMQLLLSKQASIVIENNQSSLPQPTDTTIKHESRRKSPRLMQLSNSKYCKL